MSRWWSYFRLRGRSGCLPDAVGAKSRQDHSELRPAALAVAIDQNEPVMRFDGAMHDRQAEARSAGLGRYERLEQSLLDRVGNTAALIGDLQHHRAPREALRLWRKLVIRELR